MIYSLVPAYLLSCYSQQPDGYALLRWYQVYRYKPKYIFATFQSEFKYCPLSADRPVKMITAPGEPPAVCS